MVGIFRKAEMKSNKGVIMTKVISKALKELKVINSYDRKEQWKDNKAQLDENEDLQLDGQLSSIEQNFIQIVGKDMSEDEVRQLKKNVIADEKGDILKAFQKRSMARCFKSGKLQAINTFPIDLKYPARNFRALHSK